MVIRKFCDVQGLENILEHPIAELSKEEITTLEKERYAEYLGLIEFQMELRMDQSNPKLILKDYTLEILEGIRLFYIKHDLWSKKLLYHCKIEKGMFQFYFFAQIKDLPCLHQD